MGLIIEFAYTGSCSVTVDTVMDLMCAVDQNIILRMVQTCSLFMEQQLCPDDCVSIWQFTSNCHCPDLQSKAYRYIRDHLDEVVLSEDFLLLTVGELTDLFGRDDLIVRTETTVYEGMMRWINHMADQREGHLHQLMSKIQMCLMGMEYPTNNVLSNDLVKTDTSRLAIVAEAIRLQIQWLNERGSIHFSNYIFRPRLPAAILLVTGGYTIENPTNAMEVYDTRINHWVSVEPGAVLHRAYHGTAFLDGFVHFIGGFDGEEALNGVCKFDTVRHIWRDVSPMKRLCSYFSVTNHDHLLQFLASSIEVPSTEERVCEEKHSSLSTTHCSI